MAQHSEEEQLGALARAIGGDPGRLAGLRRVLASMDGPAPDRDAPVREIPARLGDRWSALILMILQTGTYGHGELRRVVSALAHESAISQRMLTLRLRMLERDGLVARTAVSSVPPKVDYALTPLGRELTGRFFELVFWIQEHSDEVLKARARFAEAEGEG